MSPLIASLRTHIGETYLDGDVEDLDGQTPLLEWGVIDSMSMVGLLGFIESELGVRIPDEDVLPEHFATIGALARLIELRRAGEGD